VYHNGKFIQNGIIYTEKYSFIEDDFSFIPCFGGNLYFVKFNSKKNAL